jgi:hypothetical protein
MAKYFVSMAALAAIVGLPVTVHAQQGIGERIGESLDQAVEQLQDEARDVAELARIRWDKALQGANVTVELQKDGTTVLNGTVSTETAKQKAGQLAEDTVGVVRVANNLRVVAPAR